MYLVLGESIEDCADLDRCISFEEEIEFILFDLNNLENNNNKNLEEIDLFKMKLLCIYLNFLNVINITNNNIDKRQFLNTNNDDYLNVNESNEFLKYLNDQIPNNNNLNFKSDFDYFEYYFKLFFDNKENEIYKFMKESDIDIYNTLINILINSFKNRIDFIRNILKQCSNKFHTEKFNNFIIILKWKFELNLIDFISKINFNKIEELKLINDPSLNNYFNLNKIKENLLNQIKQELGLEQNRSNLILWKQYAILKLILNQPKYQNIDKNSNKKNFNIKETCKVFNTLITAKSKINKTSKDIIDNYKLCIDYALIELGCFYIQYDVILKKNNENELINDIEINLSTIKMFNEGNNSKTVFNLKYLDISINKTQKELNKTKEFICDILSKYCLETSTMTKTSATFQIGITGNTKILLLKRDFQLEYEKQQQKHQNNIKFCLFHKIYSLFLLCINDIEKLIEINEINILKNSLLNITLKHEIAEFYLILLNYLYFQENNLTKFMYKSKLFIIIRQTLLIKNNKILNSFKNLIAISLIRLKISNLKISISNDLFENNDIDLILKKCSNSLQCPIMWFALIYSNIYKMKNIVNKLINNSNNNDLIEQKSILITNLGIHHIIRRQFNEGLNLLPKSIPFWLYYIQFEYFILKNQLKNNKNNEKINFSQFFNKIIFIYYQSVRNIPYCKVINNLYNKFIIKK